MAYMALKVDKMLDEMMNDSNKMPRVYKPSNYWVPLISLHLKQINNGFDSFKRTVNMRYFNWGAIGILVHQLRPIAREIIKKQNLTPVVQSKWVKQKTDVQMNIVSAFVYRIYVASLYDFVRRVDEIGILEKLNEPREGKPYLIKYKNRYISQDLLNAVFEFYCASKNVNLRKKLEIMELGAGYGRIAYVFLSVLPKVNYTIVDIPPALYISQKYLSLVFPRIKIFKYRRFKSFSEIKEEFEKARIRFIMADQIEKLPKNYFDLTISVSTLHEMDKKQIRNYILEVDRVSKGFFYTKQWRKSRYKGNGNIDQFNYPIPKKWKSIYHKRHKIQRMFFEALYFVGR